MKGINTRPKGRGMDPHVACTRSGEGALHDPFPLASFGNEWDRIYSSVEIEYCCDMRLGCRFRWILKRTFSKLAYRNLERCLYT